MPSSAGRRLRAPSGAGSGPLARSGSGSVVSIGEEDDQLGHKVYTITPELTAQQQQQEEGIEEEEEEGRVERDGKNEEEEEEEEEGGFQRVPEQGALRSLLARLAASRDGGGPGVEGVDGAGPQLLSALDPMDLGSEDLALLLQAMHEVRSDGAGGEEEEEEDGRQGELREEQCVPPRDEERQDGRDQQRYAQPPAQVQGQRVLYRPDLDRRPVKGILKQPKQQQQQQQQRWEQEEGGWQRRDQGGQMMDQVHAFAAAAPAAPSSLAAASASAVSSAPAPMHFREPVGQRRNEEEERDEQQQEEEREQEGGSSSESSESYGLLAEIRQAQHLSHHSNGLHNHPTQQQLLPQQPQQHQREASAPAEASSAGIQERPPAPQPPVPQPPQLPALPAAPAAAQKLPLPPPPEALNPSNPPPPQLRQQQAPHLPPPPQPYAQHHEQQQQQQQRRIEDGPEPLQRSPALPPHSGSSAPHAAAKRASRGAAGRGVGPSTPESSLTTEKMQSILSFLDTVEQQARKTRTRNPLPLHDHLPLCCLPYVLQPPSLQACSSLIHPKPPPLTAFLHAGGR